MDPIGICPPFEKNNDFLLRIIASLRWLIKSQSPSSLRSPAWTHHWAAQLVKRKQGSPLIYFTEISLLKQGLWRYECRVDPEERTQEQQSQDLVHIQMFAYMHRSYTCRNNSWSRMMLSSSGVNFACWMPRITFIQFQGLRLFLWVILISGDRVLSM